MLDQSRLELFDLGGELLPNHPQYHLRILLPQLLLQLLNDRQYKHQFIPLRQQIPTIRFNPLRNNLDLRLLILQLILLTLLPLRLNRFGVFLLRIPTNQIALEIFLSVVFDDFKGEIVDALFLQYFGGVEDYHVLFDVEFAHVGEEVALFPEGFGQVVLHAVLEGAEDRVVEELGPVDALLGVVGQHPFYEVLGHGGDFVDVFGEWDVALLDDLLEFDDVGGIEWGLPEQHLIEAHPNGIDIGLVIVILPIDDLRRHIQRRAQHRLGEVLLTQQLREPKIGNLDLPIMQQNIGEFEVPMHDLILHEGLKPVKNLNQELHGLILRQVLFLFEIDL